MKSNHNDPLMVFLEEERNQELPIEGFKALNDNETYAGLFWFLRYVIDIDIDYARWLWWMFTPFLISFLLPALILVILYFHSIFLYIYKLHRHRLIDAFERDFWQGGRKTLAAFWDAQGWIWNGYEVEGLENIPENEPVLIVYYHGAIPIDFYYLLAKCILYKGKLIRTVGDRFLFKIPGFGSMLEAFKVIPGTIGSCASILKEGNTLAIAPGGVYEAQFGNENYRLMWKNRVGFAKVAIEAKVSIVPMFTQNLRECFRTVSWGHKYWHWLYTKTRLPIIPIYGFFPVKMKTFIGKPIPYNPDITPEELSNQTATAIENMIKEHQRIPGSVIMALLQRFYQSASNKVV